MNHYLELLSLAKMAALKSKDCFNKEYQVFQDDYLDVKLSIDQDIEDLIMEELIETTHLPVLSEEYGSTEDLDENDLYWIIDPLDGTRNFKIGLELYCVSIGLWCDNKPILGVIYNPVNDKIYSGICGVGANLGDSNISVSNTDNVKNSIIGTGMSNLLFNTNDTSYRDFLSKFGKTRCLGSSALSSVFVSDGTFDAYYEKGIKIWDVGASLPIIKAAGGNIMYKIYDEYKIDVYADNGKMGIGFDI